LWQGEKTYCSLKDQHFPYRNPNTFAVLRFCGFTFCGLKKLKNSKIQKLNRKTAKPQNVKPQKYRELVAGQKNVL